MRRHHNPFLLIAASGARVRVITPRSQCERQPSAPPVPPTLSPDLRAGIEAGRAFLLRLVAEYGPRGAARILRSLADEIEAPRRAGEVSRFAPPAMPR